MYTHANTHRASVTVFYFMADRVILHHMDIKTLLLIILGLCNTEFPVPTITFRFAWVLATGSHFPALYASKHQYSNSLFLIFGIQWCTPHVQSARNQSVLLQCDSNWQLQMTSFIWMLGGKQTTMMTTFVRRSLTFNRMVLFKHSKLLFIASLFCLCSKVGVVWTPRS